eukprot:12284139-Alexandrium_andersonii.AAC.1
MRRRARAQPPAPWAGGLQKSPPSMPPCPLPGAASTPRCAGGDDGACRRGDCPRRPSGREP